MKQPSYAPNLAVFKLWKDKPLPPLTSEASGKSDPRFAAIAMLAFALGVSTQMLPKEIRILKFDQNEESSSRTFNWCVLEFDAEIKLGSPLVLYGGSMNLLFKAELLQRKENEELPFDASSKEDWIVEKFED